MSSASNVTWLRSSDIRSRDLADVPTEGEYINDHYRSSEQYGFGPVPEIGPEEAETQHSAYYDLSVEGCDNSESTPLSVTPEACSEREELRPNEEET
jgi:hypothetical protein